MAVSVASISQFLGLRTDTPASKCPAEYSPDCADMVFSSGGMATRSPLRAQLTMPAEIVYDQSFLGRDGTTYRMVVDVNGAMWSVASDGTHTLVDTVAAGSSVTGVAAYGRLYMAFFNANGGSDAPRQWDGKNLYRVAQGGPGAAPICTPQQSSTDTHAIASITQPPQMSDPDDPGHFQSLMQSAGPNSTFPGNVVTVFYKKLTPSGPNVPDNDLVDAFNSGNPVYVYVSDVPAPFVAGTYLVTGVGQSVPPGAEYGRYYFTYEIGTSEYVFFGGPDTATGFYQRTLATVTTVQPVAGVSVGDNITIEGASVGAWDSDWAVAQTPESGNLQITQTSLTAGVATYSYTLISGVAPTLGQTIDITNTFNAGGILNVTGGVVEAPTGGSVGTFQISGFTGPDAAPTSESGSGITAGTEFLIEPALKVLGTSSSPINGNSVGGQLTFIGTEATIPAGKRQAVVFFITKTGLTTCVSPVARFTVPANTNAIAVSGLAIGPANVVARGVAFTPANGSRFFYMPLPESVNGIINGTSTVVNDNTSGSAVFQFNDDALQSGLAIDIPGNNLFRQVTLDTPNSVTWYSDRLFWGGGRNKVTSLLNMEMDGGTLPGSSNPTGWTVIGASGAIQQVGSAPAYVVTGPGTGEISQPAAKTLTFAQPITQPNQSYLLRLWTNGTSGNAVATLSSASTGFISTATIPLSPGYVSGNFNLPTPATIPDDLILDFKITGLVGGTSAAVRDLQLIYANNPNRNPKARASYTENPEAYDQETGNIGPNDDNTELRAMFALEESLHFLTADALYYVASIGDSEPGSWDPKKISDKCGAFNSNSFTIGQGWAAWAGPLGFFKYGVWAPGYLGGVPDNLINVIFPTWKTITSITNVFNDASAQRIYIGTSGSMMVLDYHELLSQGPAKWTPWKRNVRWISEQGFAIGAKVYQLDTASGADDDDLGPISGYYTFAPFGANSSFQKQYDYLGFQIAGSGPMTPFLYPKTLSDTPYTLKMAALEDLIDTVAEWPSLGLRGRLMFLKLGQPEVEFHAEQIDASFQLDPNAPVSGAR